jgi:hypothetical protein
VTAAHRVGRPIAGNVRYTYAWGRGWFVRIFISWSGTQSRIAAKALRAWLLDVLQAVDPWMSEIDIPAGERWGTALAQMLADSRFGIVCLTKENCTAPWILFEAGAIAKALDGARVCPYLIDLMPSEIGGGPLSQFQSKRANREETYDLLRAINGTLGERALDLSLLGCLFDGSWPELDKTLAELRGEDVEEESPSERLVELGDLAAVRFTALYQGALSERIWRVLDEYLFMRPEVLEAVTHDEFQQTIQGALHTVRNECFGFQNARLGGELAAYYASSYRGEELAEDITRAEKIIRSSIPSDDRRRRLRSLVDAVQARVRTKVHVELGVSGRKK